jgi:taurine transport system substrate-binding protein
MTNGKSLSRRDFNLLSCNVMVATLAMPLQSWAQSLAPFNLGHFSSANPQTYAKASGTLAKDLVGKATVNFVSMSSAPQFLAAMAGGSLDTCAIGSSPLVTAFAQGLDVSLVYIQKIITTAEALVVRKASGITKLADLKGRKIGVPFNTSAHFALVGALKKAQLKQSDVQLINMKPDSLFATWSRGEIDAAYIWYPFLGQLAEAGGQILLTTADLKESGLSVFDGIVVRNEFKKKYPNVLLAYLKNYAATCEKFRSQQDTVVADFSKFLGLPGDTTRQYVSTFVTLTPAEVLSTQWMGPVGARGTGVLNSLRAQAEFLLDAKQIESAPADFEKFVDSSFVARMV